MTLHPNETMRAIHDVMKERERQDTKWGEQNHSLPMWVTILGEEFGEFSKAVLNKTYNEASVSHCREELVQIAAVAVATVEFIDRWHKVNL